jgi:hypothetical protein
VPRLSVVAPTRDEAGNVDEADLLGTTITVRSRPAQLPASVGPATAVPTGELRPAVLLRFPEAAMHDASGASTAARSGWPPTASSALSSRLTAPAPSPAPWLDAVGPASRQDGPLRAARPAWARLRQA